MGALCNILEECEYGHCQLFYDYWGAESPDEAELPITYWSKARILEYCERSGNVKREAVEILRRMRLEDLRANALLYVGTTPTGNLFSDAKCREWRHTRFYSLDVANINLMVS